MSSYCFLKIRFLFLLFFLLNLRPIFAIAIEENHTYDFQEISRQIDEGNFDLQKIRQNGKLAEAALQELKGSFYFPILKGEFSFEENRREPESPFSPSRYQSIQWKISSEQKFPFGLGVQAGIMHQRLGLFQASPPNPLLPYPQTFHEPTFFLQFNIDLLQDLLGYSSKRTIRVAEIELETNDLENEISRHKLKMSAFALLFEVKHFQELQKLTQAVIQELLSFQETVKIQYRKAFAEEGDLYRMDRLIASKGGELTQLRRSEEGILRALQNLLGSSEKRFKVSFPDSKKIELRLNYCENKILQTEWESTLSSELDWIARKKESVRLQADTLRRQQLPQINLHQSIASTGTDFGAGGSFKEVAEWKHPVYQGGIIVSWSTSPLYREGVKKRAESQIRLSEIENKKIIQEKRNLLEEVKEKISRLRQEEKLIQQGLIAGEKEILDLKKLFQSGRINLYQLTEEEIELLQLRMKKSSLFHERIQNVYQLLQSMNRFQCALVEENTI